MLVDNFKRIHPLSGWKIIDRIYSDLSPTRRHKWGLHTEKVMTLEKMTVRRILKRQSPGGSEKARGRLKRSKSRAGQSQIKGSFEVSLEVTFIVLQWVAIVSHDSISILLMQSMQ